MLGPGAGQGGWSRPPPGPACMTEAGHCVSRVMSRLLRAVTSRHKSQLTSSRPGCQHSTDAGPGRGAQQQRTTAAEHNSTTAAEHNSGCGTSPVMPPHTGLVTCTAPAAALSRCLQYLHHSSVNYAANYLFISRHKITISEVHLHRIGFPPSALPPERHLLLLIRIPDHRYIVLTIHYIDI